MHVATFYSFKGGVGRTMSLVNVGVELAKKGRNVLLVDFDLEAPGIPTFDLFANIADAPGLVDYVSEYLMTNHAPDVKRFITPCSRRLTSAEGGLWLMSAGRQNASYAAHFHAINWQDLYAHREGFLLFEDLKQQWCSAVPGGFHYVLIDSRTGHTDVGGICTRQLPDAVVIMFFPNEQNLRGLEKVVRDIRGEERGPRNKHIQLHFVASNVPDLDDEENILHTQLERSRNLLDYREDDLTILHHYNSLALLKQQIFVLERPKSRLSREYRGLLDEIICANPEDREGAINALTKMQFELSRFSEPNLQPSEVEAKLAEIARIHGRDSGILYRIALLTERVGRPEDALSMLEEAVQAGVASPQIYSRRAQLYRVLGRNIEAVADAQRVLEANEKVSTVDLMGSLRVIIAYGNKLLPTVDDFPAINRQEAVTRLRVAQELMASIESLPAAERLLRGIVNDNLIESTLKSRALNPLELCLIAQEKYDEAMAFIADKNQKASEFDDIRDAFNYAMAEWGKTGSAPRDLFDRVIQLSKAVTDRGPNFLQCIAIAYACLDDTEIAKEFVKKATLEIRRRPNRAFSAWRYLETSPNEFRQDLSSIERMIDGEKISPAFFGRSRDLLSTIH